MIMEIWTQFLDWLGRTPPIIWSGALGAILASGISYFGVRSANQSSLARLRDQHAYDRDEAAKQRAHDIQQKEEDRKAAMRREAYTKFADEMHGFMAAIGGIPLKPIDYVGNSDSDALQAFLKASARIWLIAEAEAAHLSRELTSEMAELYSNVLISAQPFRLALEPVWTINKKLTLAESEVQRITIKLAELHEQRADVDILAAVETSLQKANARIGTLKDARQNLRTSLSPQHLAYVKSTFESMQSAQRTLVRLVSSLRKELHLPPDEIEFLAQHADMERRALAMVNRAFGSVDAER